MASSSSWNDYPPKLSQIFELVSYLLLGMVPGSIFVVAIVWIELRNRWFGQRHSIPTEGPDVSDLPNGLVYGFRDWSPTCNEPGLPNRCNTV